MRIRNPYPNPEDYGRIRAKDPELLKPVTLQCAAYDAAGRLVGKVVPRNPPPNANYPSFDMVHISMWDSGNHYEVDWIYAGPPSGSPLRRILRTSTAAGD